MTSLVYDILGAAGAGAGVYFLWRGLRSLEAIDYLTGLVSVLVGLLVLRSGLELLKVGAATRVVARAGSAQATTAGTSPKAAAPSVVTRPTRGVAAGDKAP